MVAPSTRRVWGKLRFANIWLVIGTRPEAIKLAPVASALRACGHDPLLVVTGQHPGLDLAEHGLGDFTMELLGCAGETNPYNHARNVEEQLRPKLSRRPDLLIVQGDTSSAFGAAQAGFATGIAVAHIEAGLRTHDPQLPWPEEEFRSAIDSRGNSGIDALLETVAQLPPEQLRETGHKQLLVTCHRRES